jgi:hypothetical protein
LPPPGTAAAGDGSENTSRTAAAPSDLPISRNEYGGERIDHLADTGDFAVATTRYATVSEREE